MKKRVPHDIISSLYASDYIPGTGIPHAAFMNKKRMMEILVPHDTRIANDLRTYITTLDIDSIRAQIVQYRALNPLEKNK
jgi:hypothetical protein